MSSLKNSDMFKFIYYSIGVFFIIYELGWIADPVGKSRDSLAFKSLMNDNKGKKWDDYSDELKKELKSKAWLLLYLLWFMFGLFTFQWVVFLVFLVFQFGVAQLVSNVLKNWFAPYSIFNWINSVIGLTFALFVIVNAYHLKIDVYAYLTHFIR